MKYIPSQPPEGINVSDEHPLKAFIILTSGAIGLIFLLLFIISLFSDSIIRFIPVKYEQSFFADKNIGDLIIKNDSAHSDKVTEYLQNLVNALHEKSGNEFLDHNFTVSLSSMDQANAFAAPGGHIVVTKELLRSIQSENGLAMVLAHEMGHHYERHPLRGLGRGLIFALFLSAISGIDIGGFANHFIDKTALVGQLAYSRKQELEADKIAVQLLNEYYGHANGASEFFSYIKTQSHTLREPPEFLSTHPSTDDRLEYLRSQELVDDGIKSPIPDHINEVIYADVEHNQS